MANSLYETYVSRGTEEFTEIAYLKLNRSLKSIHDCLKLYHVLQLSMDWVRLTVGNGRVSISSEEFFTLSYFKEVVS